ncbi:hypothetical protein BFJ71_g4784 [Fusarium oxysporum]|nr:hypothetical protein BFJ71_g4784 [Fusarium oxysporum]
MTKQEATSYSNSEDESKRSSTIDLTFAKQSLSQSVEYCEGLRVPGFLTDHRVIEILAKRTVKTAFKTMPCWHKMTPEKFQRHLKPRLPPLDSPVGSEEQVVDLFAKKGDHRSDSDAADETQLATTDHEKIEMIKKVKFRNNDNPKSKRILDESGARHDPQREDINVPRDIDADKLRTIIKGLQNNKAPGPYQVPNEAIKLGMELLLPQLITSSYKLQGQYHRYAIEGCKLYERILADMMLDVLKENPHLLLATQFGNKTTTEALQYLFRIIYGTWCSRSNDVVTILGLGMSSAYDNFYRQKLLQTLYDKDFPKWFVDIIGRVLSLRDATLRLPGIISERFGMNTGIPQGLQLSTVLFSLFLLS